MRECQSCARPVIGQAEWGAGDPAQRKAWTDAGIRMLQGRGLCRGCYLKAHRRGEFPVRVDATPTTPCERCGQPTPDQLCVDCTDVLNDMHELTRWAS